MASLFVQITEDDDQEQWHRVESFENIDGEGKSSLDFERTYRLGCGRTTTARADRMAEAEVDPGGPRHVAKGCFSPVKE